MTEELGPVQWFDWDRVQFNRGSNLPHFEQAGAIYFIDNPRHLRAGEFTLGCGRLSVE